MRLFGSVSVENFGEPGLTDYRNPNLDRRHFGARLQFLVQTSVVEGQAWRV